MGWRLERGEEAAVQAQRGEEGVGHLDGALADLFHQGVLVHGQEADGVFKKEPFVDDKSFLRPAVFFSCLLVGEVYLEGDVVRARPFYSLPESIMSSAHPMNPPNFDHVVDFTSGKDYKVVPCDPVHCVGPDGICQGGCVDIWGAFTTLQQPYWALDGRGGFTVTLVIDYDQSWVVTGQQTNAVLRAHEQGHFDIAALVVRDFFNQAALAISAGKVGDLSSTLSSRLSALDGGVGGCYESTTALDRDSPNQDKWNKKLRELKSSLTSTSKDLANWASTTFPGWKIT